MKRITILIMGLLLMSALAFGQIFGSWETGTIKDKWEEPTGEKYILVDGNDGKSWFRLYKQSSGNINYTLYASEYLESDRELTEANIKVDGNSVMNLDGYYWGGDSTHFVGLYPTDMQKSELMSQMKNGSNLKIISYDYAGNDVLDKFSLNGFTNAYNWLMKQ